MLSEHRLVREKWAMKLQTRKAQNTMKSSPLGNVNGKK